MKKILFVTFIIVTVFLMSCIPPPGIVPASEPEELCGNGDIDEGETCETCHEDVIAREICDGKDNDCDKVIDDGKVCNDAKNCGSFGKKCSGGDCKDGICLSECVPVLETCDGIDNDCDGFVDDGNVCNDNENCGSYDNLCVGNCENGVCIRERCISSKEVCDGRDNDCDGYIDDENVCTDKKNCGSYENDCTPGRCVDNKCVAECSPDSEFCDGIDNDCDNKIDEDNVCNTVKNCGSFGRACSTGESCHFRVCGNPLLHFDLNQKGVWIASDSSGNGYDATLINNPEWVTNPAICLFEGCLGFDGNNDYLELPKMPISNLIKDKFTITFWARASVFLDRPTFGFGDTKPNEDNVLGSYDSGLTFGNSDIGQYQVLDYDIEKVTKSAWQHYAITGDGENYIIYVNGMEDHKEEILIKPKSSEERSFLFGQSGFYEWRNKDYFNGYLDEFIIYGRALSAKEVNEMYLSGLDS